MNFPFCLAPMVGLSHAAMRQAIRQYLPAGAVTLWPTEMLNTRRLPYQRLGETPETMKAEEDTHLVPQILGNDENFIAPSCRRLEEWGAVAIDINMGCPVQKALKHNYGVALMGDRQYAAQVVAITARSTRLPIAVKLRAYEEGAGTELLSFVRGLVDAGAHWVVFHPRTAAQKRRGVADWNQIAWLRDQVEIPVIGNGDVQTADDALRLWRDTGCDAVMIGRALTARPWLFWQIGHRLGWPPPIGRSGPPPLSPEEEALEYGQMLRRLLGDLQEIMPSELGLKKFRFFVQVGHAWLNHGHELWSIVNKYKTPHDLEVALGRFFDSSSLRMTGQTELRY